MKSDEKLDDIFEVTCLSCGYVDTRSRKDKRARNCAKCRGNVTPKHCRKCDSIKPLETHFFKMGYAKNNHITYAAECKVCKVHRLNMLTVVGNNIKGEDDVEQSLKMREKFKELQAKEPILTQQEWVETCDKFDGCAICGTEAIEVRQMWLRVEDGGRYTRRNVVPMCGFCVTKFTKTPNPFIKLIGGTTKPYRKDRAKIILDHLMEE